MSIRTFRGTATIAGAVAVVALTLTGCGDTDPTAVSARAVSPERDRAGVVTGADDPSASDTLAPTTGADDVAALTEAALRSAEQPTVQMHMVITADGEVMSELTSRGHADGSIATATVEMPPYGQIEALMTPDAYYYRLPGLPPGKEWVRMTPDELKQFSGFDPSAAGQHDPGAAFKVLEAASEGVENLGTEDVGGVSTTHYRFLTDFDSLGQAAIDSGALSGDAADAVEMFADEVEIDAWIDDDGLVRRMSYELAIEGGPAGAPSSFGYEFQFTDYGAPIEVGIPHPDVTISMNELLAQPS